MTDAESLFARGHAALLAEDYREAVECLTRAAALRPDVAANVRGRAHAHLGLNDTAAALADFDRVAKLTPADPQAFFDRAAVLFRQKAYARAEADCTRTLELDPGRADAFGLRGDCRAAHGDAPGALADFEAALQLDPENGPTYLVARAELHLACGHPAAAVADCTAALGLDPENVPALVTRAAAGRDVGAFDSADADLTAALSLTPSAGLFAARAAVRQAAGRFPEAVADCNAALEHGGSRGVLATRGACRAGAFDFRGAVEDFTAAIAAEPRRLDLLLHRADAYLNSGNLAAAVADLLAVLARDADHPLALNQLAWVWATCPADGVRDGRKAVAAATRANELSGWTVPTYLDTLAAAYAEAGEFDRAVTWLQTAMPLAAAGEQESFRERQELYRSGLPFRAAGVV